MADDEDTCIEASCHCELNSFAVRFTTANLPISTNFCHCSACQHISGELAVRYVPFDGIPIASSRPGSRRIARHRSPSPSGRSKTKSPARSVSPLPDYRHPTTYTDYGKGLLAPPVLITVEPPPRSPFDMSNLTVYKPPTDSVARYFCEICSAQLLQMETIDGVERWSVAVGALDETDGIVQIAGHIWVGDTLDGGFADHLSTVDGRTLQRYKESNGSEELPIGWNALPISHDPLPIMASAQEYLPAFCHCRTITFNVTRPNAGSILPSCAFPDLLCAYGVTRLSRIHNSSDQKWWLRTNNTRYLAGYCMCTSCRLTSGFQVQSWAFIPRTNIIDPRTNEGISLHGDSEARLPGLKQYISSPGKYREFCGVCGAIVFWWEAGAPDLIDVSVGLFDEKVSGARAEGWLDWHKDRISFEDMSTSPGLAQDLLEGLRASKSSKN